MTDFLISQVLIGVVFVISVVTFQFRRRKHVLLCCVAITFLMAVHFLLLDAQTAALLALIASVRYFIAIYWQSSRLLYCFLFLVLASTLGTYAGPISILAGAGSTLSTIASFRGNRGFRQYSMAATTVWIIHNVLAGSPGAIVLEAFFLISNVVGYYRFFWNKGAAVTGEASRYSAPAR